MVGRALMRMATAAAVLGAAYSGVALATPAAPKRARLAGRFAMKGVITAAQSIPGEHVGQHILRTWTFTPTCATGGCVSVVLSRGRGVGKPAVKVRLSRRSTGYYVGSGSFYAPLSCGGQTYNPGERVHYTVTVRVTAAATVNGQVIVTAIHASYASQQRDNLTPCVALFGQADAARYTGRLS